MGVVLQFAGRLQDSQDWTPVQRAQLREMGSQISGEAPEVEMVFGRSEAGDPWCVVAEPDGEVILHAARIGDGFVVHAAETDRVVEGPDLWRALIGLLGGTLRERRGTVLPFPSEGVAQKLLLAFIVVAALKGEIGDWKVDLDALKPSHAPDGQGELAHPPPPDEAHPQAGQKAPPPQAHADAPVARAPPPPAAEAPPSRPHHDPPHHDPSAPAAPPPVQEAGQHLRDAAPAHAAQPPAGDGAAQGAGLASAHGGETAAAAAHPSGEANPVLMAGRSVAAGGAGPDVFVFDVKAPAAADPAAPRTLGVVTSFHPEEGDRLEFHGAVATVVGDTPVADVFASLHAGGAGAASSFAAAAVGTGTGMGTGTGAGGAAGGEAGSRTTVPPPTPGHLLAIDLNGDGRADAYVLVTDAHPIELTGQAAGPPGGPDGHL